MKLHVINRSLEFSYIFFGSHDGRRMRGLISLVCDKVDGYGVVMVHTWSLIGSEVSQNSPIVGASRCGSRKKIDIDDVSILRGQLG